MEFRSNMSEAHGNAWGIDNSSFPLGNETWQWEIPYTWKLAGKKRINCQRKFSSLNSVVRTVKMWREQAVLVVVVVVVVGVAVVVAVAVAVALAVAVAVVVVVVVAVAAAAAAVVVVVVEIEVEVEVEVEVVAKLICIFLVPTLIMM